MTIEVREPTFVVLAALAGGRKHGYGIIREVERLSDGSTKLRAGTLYAMLDRLSQDGLIEVAGEEVVDGRLRRYYVLTTSSLALGLWDWLRHGTHAGWEAPEGTR